MSDTPQDSVTLPDDADEPNEEAREARVMGEKPDLGHQRDALIDALSGSGVGSDTRAGSLRGGSVSGSDIEPDQDVINAGLARQGQMSAAARAPASVDPSDVKNTGVEPGEDADAHSAGAATG